MDASIPLQPPPRGAYGVDEIAAWFGISSMSVRRLIKDNKLGAVRMGKRILVPEESAQAFLRSLPKAS